MTTEWAVDVTYTLVIPIEDKQLEVLSDRFDELDWTVSRDPDDFLTVSGHCDDPDMSILTAASSVIDTATISLQEMGIDVELVKIAIRTPEQLERDTLSPEIPELLAASDIARLLGVSRQRVNQLRQDNSSFPPPVANTGAGQLWTRDAVDWFAGVWDRRPGRRSTPPEAEEAAVVPFGPARRGAGRAARRASSDATERIEA